MASKEVVVKELLNLLVEPHLPLRIPPGDPPIDKQQSVAKQLHGVVLLYNYYHRKQYPQAEYLDFKSFCELVVTLKPVLAWHMNCKSQSDSAESNDSENKFSMAEKAIHDACNLSFILDASKTSPVIEGWEVSKVSVLLLDSKKENCFLMFGSVNDGVWSVLEKDLEDSTSDSKLEEKKHVNKRRRVGGTKPSPSEPKTNDSSLQQLAFLAVQNATGIRRSELMVLEKHVVYSLSKAKTTACFYIIRCSKPTKLDFQTPIEYAINSLQGPLVEKSSGCWFTTPVVEYFHLLPYATIISALFLRDRSPSSLDSSISRSPKDAENTSGNKIASSMTEDTNINMMDCSDNYCSDMACEINENSDRSTNSAKSSGKEVGNEIAPLSMGDTSTKILNYLDNNCNNMVCEINENSDRSTNSAKSSGKEVVNEIAPLSMGDTSTKTLDCLDNHCNNMVCEINENSDRSSNYAKSSGKEVGNEISPLSIGGTSTKTLDCLDNNCNDMVCEINENSDRSTNSVKHSGKVVGASASPQRIGKEKTVDERGSLNNSYSIPDFISKDTSSLNQEVQEAFRDKSIDGDCDSITECAEFRAEEAKAIEGIVKEVANCNNSNESNHGTFFTGNELTNVSMESPDLEKICLGQTKDATDVGVNERELACKVMFTGSEGKASMQTVLGGLYKKEEILCTKQCHKEDKIALCDKSIRGILDGREKDVTLEVIINECSEGMCFKGTHTQEVEYQHFVDSGSLPLANGRKLESVALSLRPASQNLDVICRANNWRLPTYIVSSTQGGFRIRVDVKGVSFECSCEGDVHSDSLEAKESAATKMISRLRTMADLILQSLS